MDLRRLMVLGAAGCLAAAPGVAAQPQPGGHPETAAVEFAPEPVRIESMGLTVYLPEGTRSETKALGSMATTQISADDQSWRVEIQMLESESPDETPSEAAERAITKIRAAFGKGLDAQGRPIESQVKVLWRDQNLVLRRRGTDTGFTADRFYLSIPDGRGQDRIVRGTTLLKIAPTKFAAFTLWTFEKDWPRTRRIYEAVVAAAEFTEPGEAAAARGALVEAGKALLGRLSPDDFEAVVQAHGERFDRYYKPSPAGDDATATEAGYRRVKVWRGQRGELDPKLDRAKWKTADQEEGYLLSLEVRLLVDPDVQPADGRWTIADTEGLFFMSLDESQEMWVVRTAVRSGRGPGRLIKETGVRAGADMTVIVEADGRATTIKPMFEDNGYVSQVQAFLLSHLLAHMEIPADYGFYWYQSATSNIQLRRDSLRAATDRTSGWEVRSRLTQDSPELVAAFDSAGRFLSSRDPRGWVWEPTTTDRLLEIWSRKGLPLD